MKPRSADPSGMGASKPAQQNPIVDQDTALGSINKKAILLRRRQLNIAQDIVTEFKEGSNIKVIITPKGRSREEGTGPVTGFRLDKQRGWQLIYDNGGTQEHVTIDGKGYSASILEVRRTDKGIELLDKNDDDRAILSIERA